MSMAWILNEILLLTDDDKILLCEDCPCGETAVGTGGETGTGATGTGTGTGTEAATGTGTGTQADTGTGTTSATGTGTQAGTGTVIDTGTGSFSTPFGTGTGTISVNCCPNELPDTLYVTIINKTGDCTCLPSQVILQWNNITTRWEGGTGFGCENIDIELECFAGTSCLDFVLTSTLGGLAETPHTGCDCDPLFLVFGPTAVGGACTGTATFVVTK